MHSVDFTPSVIIDIEMLYIPCYTTYCMQEIGSKIREMRAELYDVVNEVCNQMRLLRNEIVELQHALHSLDHKQKGSLPVEPKQTENTKFSVQEVLR